MLATLGWAEAASAQGSREAERFKEEGNEQMDALRPSDALYEYRRAYELSREPALHYNMGRALEALGDYPEALSEYEQFLATAPHAVRALVPNLEDVMRELRSRVTLVSFRCNVPHARVLVRNVTVGETDDDGVYRQSFASGPATLQLVANGYAPASQAVVFEGGARQSFRLDLLPSRSAAVLSVSTKEGPASVFVDGQPVGSSPVEESVAVGTHTIVVRGQGRERTLTADVVNGETKHVVVDLDGTSSGAILKKWWFWTGVGVVVAGGVVLTTALLTSRGADSGSIAPGRATPFAFRY